MIRLALMKRPLRCLLGFHVPFGLREYRDRGRPRWMGQCARCLEVFRTRRRPKLPRVRRWNCTLIAWLVVATLTFVTVALGTALLQTALLNQAPEIGIPPAVRR